MAPPEMHDPLLSPDDEALAPTGPEASQLRRKAMLLLVFMLALVLGSAAYVLYARGAFERTQSVVLMAEDSEGVTVGMDMTFSGFPIGRVRRIELASDGRARIEVEVPHKDAHWLRESSVFTLVRGLVGNTNIRAYSGILTDPPLADGAVRDVLRGDASAEIPRAVTSARELLDTLNALAGSGGALGASLGEVQKLTERLNGPGGAAGVLLGGDAQARQLNQTLERASSLLARLDGLAGRADSQVFGPGGVMPETRATVAQLNALLAEARGSLKRVDAVLIEAQAVGKNARLATDDLGQLRAEVESSLGKVDRLINEVQRKWPFKPSTRDAELQLP